MGETEDPAVSRMTVVVAGDDAIIEQVKKQCDKLIDTIRVDDLTGEEYVDRELALVKIAAGTAVRGDVFQIADVFRGKVVDISHEIMTIEVTGTSKKIDAFIDLVRPYSIIELARTGRVALGRG